MSTNAASNANYVEIENLSFQRGELIIFDDVSMTIPEGKITAIMGPSGTGKTTLLRLVGGQLKPKQGNIIVSGQKINTMSQKALYAARREMGVMFQTNSLFTGMTVFENVAFPVRAHTEFDEDMINDLVLMKLEAVGLRGASQLMPDALSGGMARRVAMARSIALDPKLMMYDEPFTGQDPISLGVLIKLIKELNQSLRMTSVIISHDVSEVFQIADYVYIIGDKKVLGHGTVDDIKQSDNPSVQQFLQGLPDGPVPFRYPAPDYASALESV